MNQAALELLIKLKDEASKGIGNIGSSLGGLAKVAIGAMGAAGVAGAVVGAVEKTTEWANKLDSLGDVLGTTGTESAGLIVAIEGVGGNAEAITGQMSKLAGGIKNAKGELGPTGIAMKDLGIEFKNSKGEMLSSTQIIQNVADKIGNMPDGLAKTTAMTSLFGKSGKDLTDTMGALANDGLAKATQSAKDMGLALSDETINASIQMGKDMEKLKQTLMGVVVTIGSKLIPIVAPLIQSFVTFAGVIAGDVMNALGPLFTIIGELGGKLGKVAGDVMTFFKQLASGENTLGTLKAGLASVFGGAIATNITNAINIIRLLFADIESGIDPLQAISLALENLFGADVANTFAGIAETVENAWPKIKQTALDVFNKVSEVVTTVISTVMGVIGGVVKFVQDNWGTISAVAKVVFDAVILAVQTAIASAIIIINGIITTWQQVSAIIGPIITAIGTTLTNVFAAFSAFWKANSAEIIGTFTAIWTQISGIITTIQGIITIAWTAIAGNVGANNTSMLTSVTTVFNSIVTFLGGVVGFITAHGEQIKQVFSLIWTAVKTIIDLALTLIGGLLKAALQLMQGDTKGALDTLKETFSKAWELIKTLVITALNLIKTELLLILDAMLAGAGTSLENLKTAFVNGINGVLDRAKGFYADFLALGTGLITKIADGIRAAPEAVWNALKDIIMSQLNNLGSFLGIKLPFGGSGGRGANSFTGSRAASGFSESGTSGFAFGGRGASVTINISANVSGGADIDALARAVARRVRVVMS